MFVSRSVSFGLGVSLDGKRYGRGGRRNENALRCFGCGLMVVVVFGFWKCLAMVYDFVIGVVFCGDWKGEWGNCGMGWDMLLDWCWKFFMVWVNMCGIEGVGGDGFVSWGLVFGSFVFGRGMGMGMGDIYLGWRLEF